MLGDPFFGSTRAASILPSRPPNLAAAARRACQGWPRLSRPPEGLGLDWPEHGGMLDRIGAAGARHLAKFNPVVLRQIHAAGNHPGGPKPFPDAIAGAARDKGTGRLRIEWIRMIVSVYLVPTYLVRRHFLSSARIRAGRPGSDWGGCPTSSRLMATKLSRKPMGRVKRRGRSLNSPVFSARRRERPMTWREHGPAGDDPAGPCSRHVIGRSRRRALKTGLLRDRPRRLTRPIGLRESLVAIGRLE